MPESASCETIRMACRPFSGRSVSSAVSPAPAAYQWRAAVGTPVNSGAPPADCTLRLAKLAEPPRTPSNACPLAGPPVAERSNSTLPSSQTCRRVASTLTRTRYQCWLSICPAAVKVPCHHAHARGGLPNLRPEVRHKANRSEPGHDPLQSSPAKPQHHQHSRRGQPDLQFERPAEQVGRQ